MQSYLLSKHTRDESKLASDTWLGIADVGRNIDGTKLTVEEYLIVEGWYVCFFKEFVTLLQASNFVLPWYEDNRYLSYERNLGESEFVGIANPWAAYIAGEPYPIAQFGDLIRLGLRQLLQFEADVSVLFMKTVGDMYFYVQAPDDIDFCGMAERHNLVLDNTSKIERVSPIFLENSW